MKDIRISGELREIIEKLTEKQLELFSSIAQDKNFGEFTKLTNFFIDIEKNKFFSVNEYDEKKLVLDHAYSRGGIAMLIRLVKLVGVSQQELERRRRE